MNPIKSAHPDVKMVSPAVTNGNAPMGTAWLSSFLSECFDCTIDVLAVHWYGEVDYFEPQMEAAIKALGTDRPIWLTEYMCNAPCDASAFVKSSNAYLEASTAIERWAANGVAANAPFVSGNSLSAVGQAYVQ